MNINKLEIFLTLARTLNFTRAAQELYISQTAVSQQIRSLEEELDCELFVRSSRSVRLTDAGRAMEAHAAEFLSKYQEMLDAVKPYTRKRQPLRIVYCGPIEQDFLRRVIEHYRFVAPHAQLSIRYASQTRAKYDLLSGACDAVFSVGAELLSEAVTAIPVCKNPVCVAVSARSELAHYPQLTMEDILGKKMILLTPDSAEKGSMHLRRMLESMGFKPEQIEEADSIETQLFLIEMGMGISFLPANEALRHGRIAFVPLEGKHTMHEISMFYRTHTAQLEELIETVRTESGLIGKGN